MKKIGLYPVLGRIAVRKILLMAQWIFLFVFCLSMTVSAKSYTQDKISLKLENAKMANALDALQKEVPGIKLLYSENLFPKSKNISIVADSLSFKVVLSQILFGTNLVFKELDSNLVAIVPTPASMYYTYGISGTIRDEKGDPLSGATIIEKGTTNGTTTDSLGNFELSVKDSNAVISISLVGYKAQEIMIGNENLFNITLLPADGSLNEVVVVGYGTQKKTNITGAISSVSLEQGRDLPNNNVTEALRGKVAGVQFSTNGRPGQSGTILIRGARSLSGGNNPLIVLDGVFFNGSLNDINPNDIQSMDILKDASASAIYGSRAANGVILITSKKGTSATPTINVNAYSAYASAARKMKLLSPDRYIEKTVDYLTESGVTPNPEGYKNMTSDEVANYENGKILDPWKASMQNAYTRSVDFNISGRSEKVSYYNSASYVLEKGLMLQDQQKRITLRSNIDYKVSNNVTIGMTSSFINRDMSGTPPSLNGLYYASPFGSLYYGDGQPTQYTVNSETVSANPIRMSLLSTNSNLSQSLISNFYAIVKIPKITGLSYRLNYSPNYRWDHTYNFVRQDEHLTTNTKSASKFNQQSFDYVVENILTYDKRFNQDHHLDVTLMYGSNGNRYENTTATASQLSTDALGYDNLQYGGIQTVTSYAQKVNGISAMARLNYQFRGKYLLTLTGRRDGSSVFAANNKYATFPSGSVAWIMSDEDFMSRQRVFKFLKLRFSYGSVGNQAINPYQSLTLYNTVNYVYGDPGTTALGTYPANMSNANLKWETTTTANLGIDFNLMSDVLSGSVELYNSNTKNLLVQRLIPIMNGYSNMQTNIGQTNNKGIEVSLTSRNISRNKFEWTTNFAFSLNANKIVHLYGTDINNDGKEDDDITNRWFIGYPIDSYYDYVFDGIYQEGDKDIPAGYQPGFVRLKDITGDGKITTADRKVVASGGTPKTQLSMTNTFRVGNFSLMATVTSMLGWKSDFILLDPNSTASENSPGRALNQIDAGWWTPENKSNTRPSLVYTNPYGHNYYVSRDFMRLQDLSLSYDFPSNILDALKIRSLKAYVSGKNLAIITKYPGSDPEVTPTLTKSSVQPLTTSTYTAAQLKSNMFPVPRTISVGINVGF